MKQLLNKIIIGIINWAKKNKRIKAALYANVNRNLFSDLIQHEWMLSCNVRVNKYHDAIQKHVNKDHVVVDLGTGTGILSFFASKKKPKKIYAIDHGNIIELAKHLAKNNKIENIEFVNCHSSEFKTKEKVDVIIQEQIGDFLVDEDMIKNVCDLRDRILAPNGKILPARFELYIEPITLVPEHRINFLWEQKLHGIDFSSSKEWLFGNKNPVNSFSEKTILRPYQASSFLTEPESLYSFDLMTVQPDQVPVRFSIKKRVVNASTFDGFCIFFNVIFDDEISFRTSPFDPLTTWHSQIYRVEKFDCEINDIISMDIEIPSQTLVDTWRIKYTIIRNEKVVCKN